MHRLALPAVASAWAGRAGDCQRRGFRVARNLDDVEDVAVPVDEENRLHPVAQAVEALDRGERVGILIQVVFRDAPRPDRIVLAFENQQPG